MRQREWVTSTLDDCPVPEEVIGLLYRSSHNRIHELISGLSAPHRASLATFCYGRAHLHESGWLSQRLANSMRWWRQEAGLAISCSSNLANCRTRENPISVSNQIKVSLAPVNFGEFPGQSRM